ncbi:MAG TPA: phosphatidylglycerophosphatase A [Acetobacteraceae bacterium]|nr:phosphatidylglycerophosphatase A [Acetobacteraceae bacterium]
MEPVILRRIARLAACGMGIGRTPLAPGTAAAGLATVIGGGLMLGPAWVLPAAAAAASLGGLWAVRVARVEGDPGWVVIDEVAGQWIALLGLSQPTSLGLLAAFALFRLLDITKLGPVGWADRQHGPLGIMADDLFAGALAAAVLWAIRLWWPSL